MPIEDQPRRKSSREKSHCQFDIENSGEFALKE